MSGNNPKPAHRADAYKEAAQRLLPPDKDRDGLRRYTVPAHANCHPIVGAKGAYVDVLIFISDDEVEAEL